MNKIEQESIDKYLGAMQATINLYTNKSDRFKSQHEVNKHFKVDNSLKLYMRDIGILSGKNSKIKVLKHIIEPKDARKLIEYKREFQQKNKDKNFLKTQNKHKSNIKKITPMQEMVNGIKELNKSEKQNHISRKFKFAWGLFEFNW